MNFGTIRELEIELSNQLAQLARMAARLGADDLAARAQGVSERIRAHTFAIAVVGETPYAEGRGDRTGAMGLDTTDLNTINTLRASGGMLEMLI